MVRRPAEMDERVRAIEYKAGHAGFVVMGWLLILDLGLHGLKPEWTTVGGFPVDLLVINVGGLLAWGFVTIREKTLGPQRTLRLALATVLAMGIAVVVVWLLRFMG